MGGRSMKADINKIKQKIIPILKKHNVTRAGIFGSYARGEAKKNSDIDILVEIKEDISLLDFIGIKHSIEDALGKKVDLVEYHTIKPRIKERVMREEVAIL